MSRARHNWVAYLTIVRKEVARFIRVWTQSLLPSAITTLLYFLIFGRLIGSRIGLMDGVNYIDFIAPGLIMMAIVTNSYAQVSTSFFMAKFQRSIEEILVSPMPNWLILVGFVSGGIARGFANGVIVTLITFFFAHLPVSHLLTTLVVVFLSAALFSLAGLLNGIVARNFDDISIIPTFVLVPLTYLGGVFYSIKLLPVFWQDISLANPVLYMINAFRYGLLGITDVNVYFALLMITVFIIALGGWCWYLLEKGVGTRT